MLVDVEEEEQEEELMLVVVVVVVVEVVSLLAGGLAVLDYRDFILLKNNWFSLWCLSVFFQRGRNLFCSYRREKDMFIIYTTCNNYFVVNLNDKNDNTQK